MERIYPSLTEKFEDSLKETAPILGNMDARTLQMNNDRDKTDQKARELEGSLGMALQAIQRLEARTQELEKNKPKGEPEMATIVFMEDNLTKASSCAEQERLCTQWRIKQILESRMRRNWLN